MKTHHFLDAHKCGISKAVLNCAIIYITMNEMFSHKKSIPATPLTHDVTSASKLRK